MNNLVVPNDPAGLWSSSMLVRQRCKRKELGEMRNKPNIVLGWPLAAPLQKTHQIAYNTFRGPLTPPMYRRHHQLFL